ncbi:hypothetical protein [Desulfovibrio sp. Huiquan2017]|uniref:hypothetical protein n=1 Tax=Desulfovibrio sp. Huiquan2017 TaxID=2816861 RepID=UPI001A933509|nr:hypothetical protein [Desulfovibrio sp. Huiquan2017]
MATDVTIIEKANTIASFALTHLIDIIKESGEVAAECMRVDPFLGEHTFGMAFWEYKINYFKSLEYSSIIKQVTYAQNDLRFLLGSLEVRCHRVHPKTLVPLGGKKLKLEAATTGGILLPGLEEFIISSSGGTLFIGVVADKKEGVQRIFVGILSQIGKSSHCKNLVEIFNADEQPVHVDTLPSAPSHEKRQLVTRTIPNKVITNEE